jgi:hypothetical protein
MAVPRPGKWLPSANEQAREEFLSKHSRILRQQQASALFRCLLMLAVVALVLIPLVLLMNVWWLKKALTSVTNKSTLTCR